MIQQKSPPVPYHYPHKFYGCQHSSKIHINDTASEQQSPCKGDKTTKPVPLKASYSLNIAICLWLGILCSADFLTVY